MRYMLIKIWRIDFNMCSIKKKPKNLKNDEVLVKTWVSYQE